MEMFRKNAEQKRADEETKAERKRENNKTNWKKSKRATKLRRNLLLVKQ